MKMNTFESLLLRWLNLQCIIQSEVSQKEKNKYCILMCVCVYIYMYICREFSKMVLMNLSAGQQWRHRHREQIYGPGVGRRRRWDECGE